MRNQKTFGVLLSLSFAAACAPYVIKHQPMMAGTTAETFAKLAFVERNNEEARNFAKSGSSSADVNAMVERLHPVGNHPQAVRAVTYEPMPGMESMKIYLEGSGADRSYHYLAIMEGTESSGYRVLAISRSDNPFPGSNDMKPLR